MASRQGLKLILLMLYPILFPSRQWNGFPSGIETRLLMVLSPQFF